METLSQMLQSPAWWISTVVVALFINLFSSYLWGRFMERLLSRVSEKRQKRLKEKQSKLYELVKSLSEDSTELLVQYIWGATDFIIGMVFTCVGSLMFSVNGGRIGPPSYLIFGMILISLGNRKLRIARTALGLRREARDKAKRDPLGLESEQLTLDEPPTTSAKSGDHESVNRS